MSPDSHMAGCWACVCVPKKNREGIAAWPFPWGVVSQFPAHYLSSKGMGPQAKISKKKVELDHQPPPLKV